jgi:hypothetical protein
MAPATQSVAAPAAPVAAPAAEAPFPWRQVLVLLLLRLGDGIISVMLYPMLPFMVHDFGVPEDNIGLYMGIPWDHPSRPHRAHHVLTRSLAAVTHTLARSRREGWRLPRPRLCLLQIRGHPGHGV